MGNSVESDHRIWADSSVGIEAVPQLVDLSQEAIERDLGGTQPGFELVTGHRAVSLAVHEIQAAMAAWSVRTER